MSVKKTSVLVNLDLSTKATTFEEAMKKFKTEKIAYGAVEKTINGYQTSWDYFIKCNEEYSKELNRAVKWEDIDEDYIPRYISYLLNNSKAEDRTRRTYVSALRTIFYYFMEKGLISPTFKIKLPSYVKKAKEVYSSDEMKRLLQKPKKDYGESKERFFIRYRNWFIVCLFIETGIRANTLCNIRVSDVYYQKRQILCRQVKNKTQFFVPYSEAFEEILTEYLSLIKREPDDYLICSIYGEPIKYSGLRSAMDRYNLKHGVNKTGVHKHRHGFAINHVKKNGSAFKLQKLLGHSSIQMSEQYVQVYSEDLQEDCEKISLLNNEFKDVVVKRKKIV